MCKCNPTKRTYSINPKTGEQYKSCDRCREWHKDRFKDKDVKARRKIYKQTPKAKECDASYHKTEKSKASQLAYRKTREGSIRRRAININYTARKGGNPGRVSWEELDGMMKDNIEKYGELTCVYCEVSIENEYQFDHIIPRCSEDCVNEIANLALSCKNCNAQKRSSSVEDFLRKKDR
jgi:hypothetical protein